jgi:NADP-dependent alcohol dehydrogenase
MMGHELTAYYGIDHARTLAILTKSHYTYNLTSKQAKLAQCAERVFGITEGDEKEKAEACIEAIEEFFLSLGISTTLSSYTDNFEGTAQKIAERFTERGWTAIGEYGKLTPHDVEHIVEMSY